MSGLHVACILEQDTYKPGDQAPEGYLAWHEWAEVQHKAGLRQKQCGLCGLWRYPQQLSAEVLRWEAKTTRGKTVQQEAPVCNKCATPADSKAPNAKYGACCVRHIIHNRRPLLPRYAHRHPGDADRASNESVGAELDNGQHQAGHDQPSHPRRQWIASST